MTDFSTWSRDNLVQIASEMAEQLKARQPDPEMPTLRDMFAMFAMMGQIAHHGYVPKNASMGAAWAYGAADVMMVERSKK